MTKPTDRRHKHAWFALADAASCRLLCSSPTSQGTQHVEEHDAIKNTLPEQEHMRPMTGGGVTHNVEEKEKRFAGEIVKWLQTHAVKRGIDELVIFAPPRMLGVLRVVPLGALKGHVKELKGDLMRLSVGQLAVHPLVRELLPPATNDERTTFLAVTTSAHREADRTSHAGDDTRKTQRNHNRQSNSVAEADGLGGHDDATQGASA